MIDTHAHLDACDDSPAAVLERARAAGVGGVVAVGSGLASSRTALEIAEREPDVYAALGVHPHQAGGDDSSSLDELADLLAAPVAVAVGETGLDFYRDYAPRDAQRVLFARHLELARALGLPVVVHSRAADAETAALLEPFAGTVVLHCFSSPALLPTALERRYFVSFAGNVTYRNASDLRLAASQVPDDRLLAETDSPFLAPQPRRGRPNEPAYLVHTVTELARVRGVGVDALARRLDENAAEAFALP